MALGQSPVIIPLTLTSFVTLGKLPNLSFPSYKMGNKIVTTSLKLVSKQKRVSS